MSIIEAHSTNLKGITDEQIMAAFKMAGHVHLMPMTWTSPATRLPISGRTDMIWVECKETSDAVYTGFGLSNLAAFISTEPDAARPDRDLSATCRTGWTAIINIS